MARDADVRLVSDFLRLAQAGPDRPLVLGRGAATRGDVVAAARGHPELPRGSVVALALPEPGRFLAAIVGARLAGHCALLLDAAGTVDEHRRAAARFGAAALLWGGAPVEQLAGTARHPGLAAIKLTSGSTGEPCGVGVTEEALVADARAIERAMGLRPDDRFLASIPLSHSYGFSVLAVPALLRGSVLVAAGVDDALEAAETHEATVLPSTPAWFAAQLERGVSLPPSLRLLVSAGAPLRAAVARNWRARHGRAIHSFYGSTECGGVAFDRRGDAAERGCVGEPLPGVRVSITDAGVVAVESNAVGEGYLPEPRPDRLGDGRFVTEDLAELRGGELFLRGRTSDWINVKGKKVDPREVERVLALLPGAEDVAVLAKPTGGAAGEVVRAVVACREGALAFRDVTGFCRGKLSPHKVPRSVVFVRALPRTARGKLDRKRLLAL